MFVINYSKWWKLILFINYRPSKREYQTPDRQPMKYAQLKSLGNLQMVKLLMFKKSSLSNLETWRYKFFNIHSNLIVWHNNWERKQSIFYWFICFKSRLFKASILSLHWWTVTKSVKWRLGRVLLMEVSEMAKIFHRRPPFFTQLNC